MRHVPRARRPGLPEQLIAAQRFFRRTRTAGILVVGGIIAGCSGAEKAVPAAGRVAPPAVVAPPRTPTADSAAVIDSFANIVAAIDRDTLRFRRKRKPIALGAGTSGILTAWRAGNIWQRLHVDGNGAAFRTRDTYWFSNGVLLGAELSLARLGRKPAVDRVWFRNRALFRWTDGEGRRLEPAARSTQYEVQMMRSRLDSLLRVLDRDDIHRR